MTNKERLVEHSKTLIAPGAGKLRQMIKRKAAEARRTEQRG